MPRVIVNRQARPTYYQGGYRIRPWARPIIVTNLPLLSPNIDTIQGQPCVQYFTDRSGRTWRYEGRTDFNGVCRWYSRRVVDSASFDGERMVWSDMTGNRGCY